MQHVSESPHVHRIAVIGSGVSGLTAAHVASRTAHVTLYEADDRLGGHADTHEVHEGSRTLAIDTGFIVHNPRTYPVLLRLFDELGVTTQPSEMSMSIRDDGTGLEWAGALGLGGLVPTARTLGRGRYLRMLTEVPRFHRRARALLAGPDDERTLRRFLADGGFSAYFERHFMEPLVAAVWSCDPDVALDYPARYLFTFLDHHGMLGIFGSPQWRTVTGGSREYVDRLAAALPDVRTGCKVTSIAETADGVQVTDGNGWVASYDGVVVATHPDQALSMLAEPTPAQREVLSALPYSANVALLHTDTSVLPAARRAWASWNFRRPDGVVTYDLTRLQRLDTATRYLVTLGGRGPGRPRHGDRPDGVRPPALHPGVGGGPGAAPRDRHRPDRVRRRLPRLGVPRGRRPLRPRRGRAARRPGGRGARSASDEPRNHHRSHRASTPRRSPTPVVRRSPGGSRTAPTRGWSTSTTSPTTDRSAGSRPATTSATRGGRSATTSRRSSPTTG